MAVVAHAQSAQQGAMSEALQRFLRDEDEAEASRSPTGEEQLDLEHLDVTSTAVSLDGEALGQAGCVRSQRVGWPGPRAEDEAPGHWASCGRTGGALRSAVNRHGEAQSPGA